MKPNLLLLAPIFAPTVVALEKEFSVHKLWEESNPKKYLALSHPKIRGVVTSGVVGFQGEQIKNLPKLEIVACFGVAHGTLDLASTRARGIVVTNTPDASADTVADLAMGLMISVMRRICESDRFVRAGSWERGPFPMGTSLKGKICGLVGLGKIGRAIAVRAEVCGLRIAYFGPRRKSDVTYSYFSELATMARSVDCLIVACPERPDTRNMVNAEILNELGEGGFLINIARGSVVDEQALIDALTNKRISGAGLDVFSVEPSVPKALIGLENTILTSHIGTSTREIREERGALLVANLQAHFAGQPVHTPVP